MEILIVSATSAEIAPLHEHLVANWVPGGDNLFTLGQTSVEILVTGVGMVRTAFHLGARLNAKPPKLCINAGIAGAFPGKFEIGDVVHVVRDQFSEIGAETAGGKLLSIREMGLDEDIDNEALYNEAGAAYEFLPLAKGITVNTVHGHDSSIADVIERLDPDVETMESAAFFYACLKANTPFLAIRGISNMVEPRDRSAWDIQLAISNLNAQLIEMLDLLKS